jgi:hypothetical protein
VWKPAWAEVGAVLTGACGKHTESESSGAELANFLLFFIAQYEHSARMPPIYVHSRIAKSAGETSIKQTELRFSKANSDSEIRIQD